MDEITMVFDGSRDFEAFGKANEWCRLNDVAVGATERDAPIGLMYGRDEYAIGKWRNLSANEKSALDGRMTGDRRHGPITIRIKQRRAA